MPKITGTFYFEFTAPDTLKGKYNNILVHTPEPEKATRKAGTLPDPSDPYIGDYDTVWQEGPTTLKSSLKVSLVTSGVPAVYDFVWERGGKDIFKGLVMVSPHGELIGSYWEV